MAEYVKVEVDGRVAIVTLDHPPVNALSTRLLEELEEEYDKLDRSDETRAIVLRGEGEKAFVAGADITEFPAMREQIEEAAESGSARGIQKLAARMDAGRTPVVAAIHGYCLGGGLELAMACDIRIAAEDADLPLSEGMRREAQGFIRCIGSADGAEGVMAFLEKRKPEFTGK